MEKGVQIVERQILAVLRKRVFFSLSEANEAIWQLLKKLNGQPFQKLAGSRKSCFDELEKPLLRPLPQTPYVLSVWKKATVHPDYHVEVDKHFYSVPHPYVKDKVDVRLTQHSLEVFLEGKRIASPQRRPQLDRYRGRHTTLPEHMPSNHKFRGDWNPDRFIRWANKLGEHTAQLIEAMLRSRKHPEQSFRSCFGILRLAKTYGDERLEAACKRACHFKAYSFKSVESILKHKLDQEPLPDMLADNAQPEPKVQKHQNVRGASYYSQNEWPQN